MDPEDADLRKVISDAVDEAWIKEKGVLPASKADPAYNAFQHVYASALMAKMFGRGVALAFGIGKEARDLIAGRKDGNILAESYKDSFNDIVGAQLGKYIHESALSKAAMNAVDQRSAIVHTHGEKRDPRIPHKPNRLPIGLSTDPPLLGHNRR